MSSKKKQKKALKAAREAYAEGRQAPVVLDIASTALDADDKRRLADPLVGGLILFARNWQGRQQLTELVAEIKEVRPDVLVCVDHEGGRVQRFRTDGYTHLPPMRALGEMWMDDAHAGPGTGAMHAMQAARAAGYVLGAELRACGVDLSFTPVLDLDFGESSIIGDRAFHRDPRVVTLLAKSLNHGLALAGMANCGKHFPGHGFVKADSHIAVPVDERTLEEILGEDAAPYDWLGLSLAAVMPAHVIYPKVDRYPAGFSKKWLSMLRKRFAFDGVIFSDDLSMEGASVAGGVVDGAHAALRAGCDMVLICNSPDKVDVLLDGLDRTLREPSVVDASTRRILRLIPMQKPADWNDLQKDARYLAARKTIRSLSAA
ncbi:MAG: beta-N-acetylhexosaminidase [Herminiimonas sp.]|nr:beta-N-acetylhexosaminidase [Herminiimonas sp.]